MHDNQVTVIGLGNDFITDDGVGIHAVRQLRGLLNRPDYLLHSGLDKILEKVIFRESFTAGLEILDYVVGFERAILIDAVLTGEKPPGTIYRFIHLPEEEPVKIVSSHQINLRELFGIAKLLRMDVPSRIVVFGMEVEDVTTFSQKCTASVHQSLPRLVDAVMREILLGSSPPSREEYCLDEFPRRDRYTSFDVDGVQFMKSKPMEYL